MNYQLNHNLSAINKSIALWEFLIQKQTCYDRTISVVTAKNTAYKFVFDELYQTDLHGCPLCEYSFSAKNGCKSCPGLIEFSKFDSSSNPAYKCETLKTPWSDFVELAKCMKPYDPKPSKAMLKLLLRSRENMINSRTYEVFYYLEVGIGYTKRKSALARLFKEISK